MDECVHDQCSTPFGISDQFTRAKGLGSSGTSCAQRLSASQINSHGKQLYILRGESGAQRLSASQINSHLQRRRGIGHQNVLNAFRHLRSIHMQIHVGTFPTTSVLNAFRHLRSIHIVNWMPFLTSASCSTPFGISDQFTGWALGQTSKPEPKCSTPFGISDQFTIIASWRRP